MCLPGCPQSRAGLLHDGPGAVERLAHVPHLPGRLAQRVALLLHLGTKLGYSLLKCGFFSKQKIKSNIIFSFLYLFLVYCNFLPVHLVHEGLVLLGGEEDSVLVPGRGELAAQA